MILRVSWILRQFDGTLQGTIRPPSFCGFCVIGAHHYVFRAARFLGEIAFVFRGVRWPGLFSVDPLFLRKTGFDVSIGEGLLVVRRGRGL